MLNLDESKISSWAFSVGQPFTVLFNLSFSSCTVFLRLFFMENTILSEHPFFNDAHEGKMIYPTEHIGWTGGQILNACFSQLCSLSSLFELGESQSSLAVIPRHKKYINVQTKGLEPGKKQNRAWFLQCRSSKYF